MSRMPRILLAGTAAAPAPTAFAPFDPAARGAWAWRQPARWRGEWLLHVDETAVARLREHGLFGHRGELWTADERWTLTTRFPGDVLVTREGTGTPVLRYRMGWFGGGRIERGSADTLLWRRESFWTMRWALVTADRLPLVHVLPSRRLFTFRHEASLELEDAARRLPDLAVLLALGWLLTLRAHRSARTAHGG